MGTYVNGGLYMVGCLQLWRYFESYPADAMVVKAACAIAFLLDTATTISSYACVYEVSTHRF